MSNRDLYVDKMKAQLDSWNASIDKLEAQAKNAEADAQIKYREQIAELKKHREEARENSRNYAEQATMRGTTCSPESNMRGTPWSRQ